MHYQWDLGELHVRELLVCWLLICRLLRVDNSGCFLWYEAVFVHGVKWSGVALVYEGVGSSSSLDPRPY